MTNKTQFSVRKLPGFTMVALLCFVLLYVPILTLVVYSFNAGSSLALWEGISIKWYYSAWQNKAVQQATGLSLVIAIQAALYSTVVATMAALGTTRTRPYRGQTVIYTVINQPLMVPEIVTAVALLICFAVVKEITQYRGISYLGSGAYGILHTICLLAHSRTAGRYEQAFGNRCGRSIRDALAQFQICYTAAVMAGDSGRRNAGVCYFT